MKKFIFDNPFRTFLLALLIIGFIARSIGNKDSAARSSEVFSTEDSLNSEMVTETEAYVIARDFVKDNIDTPSTAEFPGEYSTRKTGKNRWEVSGDLDAQNGFGAMKRAKFFVELEYNGGEWDDKNNWTLISFDLKQ